MQLHTPDSPEKEYQRRYTAQQAVLDRCSRLHDRLANARLTVFVAGIAIALLAWWHPAVHPLWLLLPVGAFAGLLVVHSYILAAGQRARVLARFYRRGLDRLAGRWQGGGVSGEEFLPERHPCAEDLDLFGPASLFELLCAARTSVGRKTLAEWMTRPAERETILARQDAVAELRECLELRENLALAGEQFARRVDPACLRAWAALPPELEGNARLTGAAVLAGLALSSVLLWAASGAYGPFLLVAAAEVGFLGLHRRPLARIAEQVSEPSRELHVLARVLKLFEQERFKSPLLRDLQRRLFTGAHPASREIARLDRLIFLMDAQFNQLFVPVGVVTQWGIFCAYALERWRRRHARELTLWLDAIGALEALNSIAGYAYEHPGDPFPEIREGTACFIAKAAGHPLLDRAACVRNDVALTAETPVLIVSGSNMSGKSTLLRTVGVNTVLAHIGAPVYAKRLQLTPLALGATMRVHDSIQEGASGFYAEILRLKQLQELAEGPAPLLFLLDEILHGTNSHDRLTGAEALIRTFIEAGAVGLLTTHDLAVTRIEKELGGMARNVHLQDQVVAGELVFDYTLRPGVVGKSNALELMRRVGLRLEHGPGHSQDGPADGASPH